MSDFEQRLQRLLKDAPVPVRKAALATRLMFYASHRLESRTDEVLAPFGLAMREYLLLAMLNGKHETPVSPSDLSLSLDATRTQITRLLDGLEQRGLVKRKPRAEDRRGLGVEMTAAGARLLGQAAPRMHQAYKDWWSCLGTEGLDAVIGSLRQLNTTLARDDTA